MKKLMIAAAIVCAAAFAHAAACDWTVGNVTGVDSEKPLGYLCYLIKGDSAAQAATAAALASGDLSILSSDAVVKQATVKKPIPMAEMYSINETGFGSYTAKDWYDMYTVILDSTTTADAAENFQITSSMHVRVPDSGNLPMSFGNAPNNWNTIQTVPEPTSGLLLLLGVAGLALRRRRA